MKVSVLIPVYNAEPYIQRAVESALEQPETGEVILVEDGSPDGSFAVCQKLYQEYEKVKLYRHPDGVNLGVSASRNLAIKKASCEIISFLDADDYYLSNHLQQACHILATDETIDGIYSTIAWNYEDETAQQAMASALGHAPTFLRPPDNIAPEHLFRELVYERVHFSIISLVIRRRFIQGFEQPFKLKVQLGEDTAFLIRMAASGRFVAGITDKATVVAQRHANNRSNISYDPEKTFRVRMSLPSQILEWAQGNATQSQFRDAMRFYVRARIGLSTKQGKLPDTDSWGKRLQMVLLLFERFDLWRYSEFWKALWYYFLPGKLRPQDNK